MSELVALVIQLAAPIRIVEEMYIFANKKK